MRLALLLLFIGFSIAELGSPWVQQAFSVGLPGCVAGVGTNSTAFLFGGCLDSTIAIPSTVLSSSGFALSCSSFSNDLWKSSNGLAWVQQPATTQAILARAFAASAWSPSSWFISGGLGVSGLMNDVWIADGSGSSVLATSRAPWVARAHHTSVYFQGLIWVMGGYCGSTCSQLSDIWSSDVSGAAWILRSATAEFGGRSGHVSTVFSNSIYIFGGASSASSPAAMKSSDGVNWVAAGSGVGYTWGARRAGASATPVKGILILAGGWLDGLVGNDVYEMHSDDVWSVVTSTAPWTPRLSHNLFASSSSSLLLSPGVRADGSHSGNFFTSANICGVYPAVANGVVFPTVGISAGNSVSISCNTGYSAQGVSPTCEISGSFSSTNVTCADIDECSSGAAVCRLNAACENVVGSFTCTCSAGYAAGTNACVDIDECATGTHMCVFPTLCVNSPGSFVCLCSHGFSLDSAGVCQNTNECASNNGGCSIFSTCTDATPSLANPTTRTCRCDVGYFGSGAECADVNECSSANGGCEVTCINSPGSFSCACLSNFVPVGTDCVGKISPGISSELYISQQSGVTLSISPPVPVGSVLSVRVGMRSVSNGASFIFFNSPTDVVVPAGSLSVIVPGVCGDIAGVVEISFSILTDTTGYYELTHSTVTLTVRRKKILVDYPPFISAGFAVDVNVGYEPPTLSNIRLSINCAGGCLATPNIIPLSNLAGNFYLSLASSFSPTISLSFTLVGDDGGEYTPVPSVEISTLSSDRRQTLTVSIGDVAVGIPTTVTLTAPPNTILASFFISLTSSSPGAININPAVQLVPCCLPIPSLVSFQITGLFLGRYTLSFSVGGPGAAVTNPLPASSFSVISPITVYVQEIGTLTVENDYISMIVRSDMSVNATLSLSVSSSPPSLASFSPSPLSLLPNVDQTIMLHVLSAGVGFLNFAFSGPSAGATSPLSPRPLRILRKCSAGFFSASGFEPCVFCLSATYSQFEKSTSCIPCPAGTTSAPGSSSLSSCVSLCPPGSFSLSASVPCTTCAKGTYADGSGFTNCKSCPGGYSTEGGGATTVGKCVALCEPGYFSPAGGVEPCSPCEFSFYAPTTGLTACVRCPVSTSTKFRGSVSVNNCDKFCPPGWHGVRGLAPCINCEIGTFNGNFGASACTQCPANTTTVETKNINSTACISSCSPGTISPTGLLPCSLCPASSFSSLFASTACTKCPADKATSFPGASSSQFCVSLCPAGYASANAQGVSPCVLCAVGTYSSFSGSTTCTKCSAGFSTFSSGSSGASACKKICDPGQFSPTGVETCTNCASGFFSDQIGSRQCSSCPVGTYSPAGASACTQCPAGQSTALPSSPSSSPSPCLPGCPPGFFNASSLGLLPCISCPFGSYSSSYRSSACVSCPLSTSTLSSPSLSLEYCSQTFLSNSDRIFARNLVGVSDEILPWSKRYEFTTTIFDSRLLIIGGSSPFSSGKIFFGDVWMAPFSSDELPTNWTQILAPWRPRIFPGVAAIGGGKLILIGGEGEGGVKLNDVWIFDSNFWTVKNSSAQFSPRRNPTVLFLNLKIFLIGGETSSGSQIASTFATDVWVSSEAVSWRLLSRVGENYINPADLSAPIFGVTHESNLIIFFQKISLSSVPLVFSSSDGVNWENILGPFVGNFGTPLAGGVSNDILFLLSPLAQNSRRSLAAETVTIIGARLPPANITGPISYSWEKTGEFSTSAAVSGVVSENRIFIISHASETKENTIWSMEISVENGPILPATAISLSISLSSLSGTIFGVSLSLVFLSGLAKVPGNEYYPEIILQFLSLLQYVGVWRRVGDKFLTLATLEALSSYDWALLAFDNLFLDGQVSTASDTLQARSKSPQSPHQSPHLRDLSQFSTSVTVCTYRGQNSYVKNHRFFLNTLIFFVVILISTTLLRIIFSKIIRIYTEKHDANVKLRGFSSPSVYGSPANPRVRRMSLSPPSSSLSSLKKFSEKPPSAITHHAHDSHHNLDVLVFPRIELYILRGLVLCVGVAGGGVTDSVCTVFVAFGWCAIVFFPILLGLILGAYVRYSVVTKRIIFTNIKRKYFFEKFGEWTDNPEHQNHPKEIGRWVARFGSVVSPLRNSTYGYCSVMFLYSAIVSVATGYSRSEMAWIVAGVFVFDFFFVIFVRPFNFQINNFVAAFAAISKIICAVAIALSGGAISPTNSSPIVLLAVTVSVLIFCILMLIIDGIVFVKILNSFFRRRKLASDKKTDENSSSTFPPPPPLTPAEKSVRFTADLEFETENQTRPTVAEASSDLKRKNKILASPQIDDISVMSEDEFFDYRVFDSSPDFRDKVIPLWLMTGDPPPPPPPPLLFDAVSPPDSDPPPKRKPRFRDTLRKTKIYSTGERPSEIVSREMTSEKLFRKPGDPPQKAPVVFVSAYQGRGAAM